MHQESLIQVTSRDGFGDLDVLTEDQIEEVVAGIIERIKNEKGGEL